VFGFAQSLDGLQAFLPIGPDLLPPSRVVQFAFNRACRIVLLVLIRKLRIRPSLNFEIRFMSIEPKRIGDLPLDGRIGTRWIG